MPGKKGISGLDVTERTEKPASVKGPAVEDLTAKYVSQYFGRELLKHLGITKRIRGIAPTESVRLEVRQMYEDFNFEMEDGEWLHLEFESDGITVEDMRRFREYEAATSRTHRVPVVTWVVCSAKTEKSMESIREGINTYRVRVFRFKNRKAEDMFERLRGKTVGKRTQEDLLEVALAPLYGGKMAQKERIQEGLTLIREGCPGMTEEKVRQMTAVLYFLATKFLKEKELEAVKMMVGMNAFGKLYYDDGVRDGMESGRQEGFTRAFCLMVRDGLLSLEDAAKRTDMSVEDFREKMQEQPEAEQETASV